MTRRAMYLALAAFLASTAYAAPQLYFFTNVFSDGGTVSGSFTYDPTTNIYGNVSITSTTGAARTGANFSFVCGQDVPNCNGVAPDATGALFLTSTTTNQTGLPALSIFYIQNLPTSECLGGLFNLEADCNNATCSAPSGPTRTGANGVICPADPFHITYTSNLNVADGVINITNTGASATMILAPGQTGSAPQNNINGNLCVNLYAFAADEQEVACCSCLVTPNALWSASVKTALLNSTLTPSVPNEVVIKMISSVPTVGTGGAQMCNPAAITQTLLAGQPGQLAAGANGWATRVHGFPTATGPNFRLTETPISSGTLSQAELQRVVQECQFIQVLGSGQFGICKGCSNVGMGAAAE